METINEQNVRLRLHDIKLRRHDEELDEIRDRQDAIEQQLKSLQDDSSREREVRIPQNQDPFTSPVAVSGQRNMPTPTESSEVELICRAALIEGNYDSTT